MASDVESCAKIEQLMRILGVTGPSGAGKSMIAAALARRGYKVIDGDALAQTLYLPGRPSYYRIRRVFGSRVIGPYGRIDKTWLGDEVFHKPRQMAKLNSILHPVLKKRLREKLDKLKKSGSKRVVVDMAVLFQARAESLVDEVILVEAPEKTRITRLIKRHGISTARARCQARAWKALPQYRTKASLVLSNTGRRDQCVSSLSRFLIEPYASG
jgi:dephospho-CoA kinase